MAIIKNPSIVVPQDYKVVWNQYWHPLNTYNHNDGGSATFVNVTAYEKQITIVKAGNCNYYNTFDRMDFFAGHKYFMRTMIKDEVSDTIRYFLGGMCYVSYEGSSEWQSVATIYNNTTAVTGRILGLYASLNNGERNGDVISHKNNILIDLTQMFGSGNEPTTTAEFESWLQENNIDPDSYIPLDYGTLISMTKPSWIV